MRGSLLVPTLNEAATIGHVLREFRTAALAANGTLFRDDPIDWETLVIDGASTDGTAERAAAEGARVIVERRPGYGRAYRTGFAEATGAVLATLDGDGTYPATEIPRLVRKLLDENLDFLTCNRLAFLDRRAMTTEHRIGNWVLNSFLRIAFAHYLSSSGLRLADSQSGMWVFRREVLDRIHLTQDGMPMSEELKIEVILHGLKAEEVPIRYAERWGGPPKLSSWQDGRRNLLFLLTKRLELARQARGGGYPIGGPQKPAGR